MNIRPVSPAIIKVMAASAAEAHTPLKEANFYERDSELWHTVNRAYRDTESRIHEERRAALGGSFPVPRPKAEAAPSPRIRIVDTALRYMGFHIENQAEGRKAADKSAALKKASL